MVNACLVIIFNHRYDKNIPVLEKLYAPRFRHIFFLVPFYDGDKENVIPVYEGSNYFQGYVAQAFRAIYRPELTHYIFTGDDCILNPAITESNVAEQVGLPDGTDFCFDLIDLASIRNWTWWHAHKGVDFFTNRKGVEAQRELPSYEEAVSRFSRHGIEVQPLSYDNLFGPLPFGLKKPVRDKWLKAQYLYHIQWKKYRQQGKIRLPYPIVGGYSDLFIITRETMPRFARYCGITAALGLFVEIAVPTCLLLSAEKILQEKQAKLKGLAMWSREEVEALEKQCGNSLQQLLQQFPAGQLVYHPVKLSRWKNDL
jgi:hypothetical protein